MEITLEVLAERIGNVQKDIADIKDRELPDIKADIRHLSDTVSSQYVTQKQFEDYQLIVKSKYDPIQKLMYGVIGIIGTAILLAILELVLRSVK